MGYIYTTLYFSKYGVNLLSDWLWIPSLFMQKNVNDFYYN